ncbi:thioredoxin domain-containing protein [Nakamurella aerolata]|uniref:Thioredoxin domain-containing protein n=1 Tax=Nakamurella aerolata TaxID=1656892 RepID=A0A849A9Q5_9ACTN|nr:thioredoxin domain-containing protein [Nakamurella aerolata]NNG37269.1 thioredoxin domain-containing protein [Nakamurella aerolata]
MVNRLQHSLSPYLRQHADNPVDWREWDDDALALARESDRPILLSVGYAACHWCHVMAHESFEDDEVAAAINETFVPIKVDREERPDIDAVYMTATTAMNGHGGWPMTCVLLPSGEPVWTDTYLPKPALLNLLGQVRELWRDNADAVRQQGFQIAEALRRHASGDAAPDSSGQRPAFDIAAGAAPMTAQDTAAAVDTLRRQFDPDEGGFGTAPKFPPSMVLEFLLRQHARTANAAAITMAETTFAAMARGGMFDQLAGGFARYSVDRQWVVPHFEKMLYDNALLLRGYLHWWRASGAPLARRVAEQTADFLLADLRTAQGMFAASLDADTDGVEGASYVFSPAQLVEILGERDGARAAELLSVTESGTFEHGLSTLQRRADPADEAWWGWVRRQLLSARRQRPQPARDDKVVTAWNGLAIAALAEAGTLLERPEYLAAAKECADALLATQYSGGRLRRVSLDGAAGSAAGVAEDYGNLADGLVTLFQITGERHYLDTAGELLETARELFVSTDPDRPDQMTVHDTAADSPPLLWRPSTDADNAEPCGASALAGALLTWSALTGDTDARTAAEAIVRGAATLAAREPRFAGHFLSVAEAMLAGPLQVAVVGAESQAAAALLKVARHNTSPGLVAVAGRPDEPGVPLLAERSLVHGRAAAYVCRGFVCQAPVTEPDQLAATLARRP